MAELDDTPGSAPPELDPPFRGYIETTYDSLLVFEAARRGMIPRVTRRLIERERGMVQSGAVFVFDEHESGIKRWTDGLVWSPSRILGNFLVYRETDKKPLPANGTPANNSPPPNRQIMGPPGTFAESSRMAAVVDGPAMAQGAMRPRAQTDPDGMDRNKERQLVGSLTNSYKFKRGGLVKKTMSVTVMGYSQHMISYYHIDDVLSGKLRAPSTIPELAALDISPDYLSKQNFRFPPLVEVGPDGIPRYRGEGEEPGSPTSPMSGMSLNSLPKVEFDAYSPFPNFEAPRAHTRAITAPSPHPISPMPISPPPGAISAGYAQTSYFDQTSGVSQLQPSGSLQRTGSIPAMRTGSSQAPSKRYDPYGQSAPNPRTGGLSNSVGPGTGSAAGGSGSRRLSISVPQTNGDYYNQQQQAYDSAGYDIKPTILPSGQAIYQPGPTQHQSHPPASAPSTYAEYYGASAPPSAAGNGMYPPPPPTSGAHGHGPSSGGYTLPPLQPSPAAPGSGPIPPALPGMHPGPALSPHPHAHGAQHSPSYPSASSGWPGSAPLLVPSQGHQATPVQSYGGPSRSRFHVVSPSGRNFPMPPVPSSAPPPMSPMSPHQAHAGILPPPLGTGQHAQRHGPSPYDYPMPPSSAPPHQSAHHPAQLSDSHSHSHSYSQPQHMPPPPPHSQSQPTSGSLGLGGMEAHAGAVGQDILQGQAQGQEHGPNQSQGQQNGSPMPNWTHTHHPGAPGQSQNSPHGHGHQNGSGYAPSAGRGGWGAPVPYEPK